MTGSLAEGERYRPGDTRGGANPCGSGLPKEERATEHSPSASEPEGFYSQSAICTETDDCPAGVDEHTDNCPVEQKLRETFGF